MGVHHLSAPVAVGFIANGISGPGSGAWNRLQSYADVLSRRGHRVVVTLDSSQDSSSLRAIGCSIVRVDFGGRFARMASRSAVAESLVYDQGVDVVHIETPPFRISGLPVPAIATVHDLRYFYRRSHWWGTGEGLYQRLLERRDIRSVDAILTVSEWSRRDLVRYMRISPEKVFVAPNIVTVPSAQLSETVPEWCKDSHPYVLALGHLEPRKNLEVLIRAQATPKWPSDVRILIAGKDAGSLARLRSLATAAGHNVEFLGPVSESQKWSLIRHAMCVAVPSLIEGFGIVPIEALGCGVPVVMSSSTALAELAQPGLPLVDPNDVHGWAQAVLDVAEGSIDRGLLRRTQENVRLRFSPDAVYQCLRSLYERTGQLPLR